jgi:hypothetical protein
MQISCCTLPAARLGRVHVFGRLFDRAKQNVGVGRRTCLTLGPVTCSFRREPGRKNERSQRRGKPLVDLSPATYRALAQRYAFPALTLLLAAAIVGPIVGALVISAVGFALALTAAAAAFSLSWVFVPLFLSVVGIPLLIGSGWLVTGAATMLLFPVLVQASFVAGGIWLGSLVAKNLFKMNEVYADDAFDEDIIEGRTIDIDGESVESASAWSEQAERELREFDELLRQRERFRRGG